MQHHAGYAATTAAVRQQSWGDDLQVIDALFGRDSLPDDATDDQIKAECLRQLEIDWRPVGQCAGPDDRTGAEPSAT